jgi:uridine kinase
MNTARGAVVEELARILVSRAQEVGEQVLRVAVTGITASGKSTLTVELTQQIQGLRVPCVRVPVDGFHHPRALRYQRGRESAEGYYRDAYNYELLVARALLPLGPGGNCSYVSQAFDLARDAPIEVAPTTLAAGSIALFDASFLLRPEIRDHFDYRVLVHTSFETAEVRGVRRDTEALGGVAAAQRLYRQRYHAAQRIYLREAEPWQYAEAMVINEDVEKPVLFTRAAPAPA